MARFAIFVLVVLFLYQAGARRVDPPPAAAPAATNGLTSRIGGRALARAEPPVPALPGGGTVPAAAFFEAAETAAEPATLAAARPAGTGAPD